MPDSTYIRWDVIENPVCPELQHGFCAATSVYAPFSLPTNCRRGSQMQRLGQRHFSSLVLFAFVFLTGSTSALSQTLPHTLPPVILAPTAPSLSLLQRPELMRAAFSPAPLRRLADAADTLPIDSLRLVKAFSPHNGDNRFAQSVPLLWVSHSSVVAQSNAASASGQAGRHVAIEPQASRQPTGSKTLGEVVEGSPGALSARVADSLCDARGALGGDGWFRALDSATRRPLRNADVYVTSRRASTSASLGWHIDDVDVLLVLMRGQKRFRVAGPTVGSTVVIDHMMQPGDAIYIPALTFHTGGQSDAPEESMLLSTALPLATPAAERATEAVDRWRRAKQLVLSRLSDEHDSWDYASTGDGRRKLRTLMQKSKSEQLLEQFLPSE
eukprot:2068427-Pleurochrysis_carterae.AAC.4